MPDIHDIQDRDHGDGQRPSPSSDAPRRGLKQADPATLADAGRARERQREETMSFGRWVLELVVLLGLAWVLAFGIKTYVVQPFIIPSSSMEPTLMISDRVLVNRFIYRFTAPKAGDIVVFQSPQEGNLDLIKRVVAVAGQTADIRDGKVFVDGQQRVEPFVNQAYPDDYTADATVTVPAGTVYVMGDNRANSKDSRYIGPQRVSDILGKTFAIYWPLGRLRWFE